MKSIINQIVSRIYGKGRGWVFTPNQFLDLGSRQAIGIALFRLQKKGTIRRLSQGLYDYPKSHPVLGKLSPSPDKIAKAIAYKNQIRIQPSGAYAVNLLGLSDQVPAKIVFLTDGPTKKIKINNQEIIFKKTTPKHMATAGKIGGLLIQAFRYLGKKYIDDKIVTKLKESLSNKEKKQLLKDIKFAPAWIGQYIIKITEEKK